MHARMRARARAPFSTPLRPTPLRPTPRPRLALAAAGYTMMAQMVKMYPSLAKEFSSGSAKQTVFVPSDKVGWAAIGSPAGLR